ncbi:hypothetical protein [Streptosporangium roseum]|uniref:hypothetical protein n=1 Tax=Streptosporangium roseum TaxID=2001 RepID=UPI003317DEB7
MVNTFHELGGAIGVAVLSTIAAPSLIGQIPAGQIPAGFGGAFMAMTVVALATALIAAVLLPSGELPVLDGPHVH